MTRPLPIFIVVLVFLTGAFGFFSPASAAKVETVMSPGGISAWLVRDSSIPLISMNFTFRGAGASLDPKGKGGRANMVSALLDEGAGNLDSQAFQRQLENQSIRLSFNAGKDTFGGSLKMLNKFRDSAIKLTALALTKPRFDKDAVQRIRAQILTGLKSRSSRPGFIANRVWSNAIYGEHPYARPTMGTQKSVAGLSVEDLRSYVSESFSRDRLIVGVVGDVTASELKLVLDQIFGGLPGKRPRQKIKSARISSKGTLLVVKKAIPQSVVIFGQKGVTRSDPNFYVAYVMNHILGGGSFTSRLYNEVREKRGLAYSVYTYLSPRQMAPLLAGRLSTANDRVAESLRVLREEWQRMAVQGVSDAELENAKSFINGSFPLRFSSSEKISELLVTLQYYQLGADYLKNRRNLINAVSANQIKQLAKRVIKTEALTVTIVGDPKGIKASGKVPLLDY